MVEVGGGGGAPDLLPLKLKRKYAYTLFFFSFPFPVSFFPPPPPPFLFFLLKPTNGKRVDVASSDLKEDRALYTGNATAVTQNHLRMSRPGRQQHKSQTLRTRPRALVQNQHT